MYSRLFLVAIFATQALLAQRRVDARNTYHRVFAVVNIVGTGTAADPRRPAYAPLPVRGKLPSRSGIIAFNCQLSDNTQQALCEFVAADPAALRPILSDKTVKSFEKGKITRNDLETELEKYKKDFELDKFGVSVP